MTTEPIDIIKIMHAMQSFPRDIRFQTLDNLRWSRAQRRIATKQNGRGGSSSSSRDGGRGSRLPAHGLSAVVLGLLALVAAPAAVVDVLAQVLLAPVLPVLVAVAPPELAAVPAFAFVALGGGVGRGVALHFAAAAVVDVAAMDVGVAPVFPCMSRTCNSSGLSTSVDTRAIEACAGSSC